MRRRGAADPQNPDPASPPLEDFAAGVLAEFLRTNHTVVELLLAYNRIGDVGEPPPLHQLVFVVLMGVRQD